MLTSFGPNLWARLHWIPASSLAVALDHNVKAVLSMAGLTLAVRFRTGVETAGKRDSEVLELTRLQILERQLGQQCAARR